MKTLAVVFYCLMVPSFLFAQIQITSSDFTNTFTPGKSWLHIYTQDSLKTTMNVGNASGSPQTWTVPANIFKDTTVQTNMAPANTPYSSYFPTATNAEYVLNLNYAGIGTSDSEYVYYRITPDTMLTLGAANHIMGNGQDTVYIGKQNYISAIFPVRYGQKYVAQYDSTSIGPGDYQTTTLTVHYDAFGTITFPNGTFNALRQTQTSKTDIYTNGSLSSSIITHNIGWLTKSNGSFNLFAGTGSQISGNIDVNYPNLNLFENSTAAVNEQASNIPEKFELFQNYPNPFNPTTRISFNLPEQTNVTLNIYNMLGQKISTLINREMQAGNHSVEFNASSLSSGMYLYRITTDRFSAVKKMILLK